jgi:hypothetical protein
MRARPHEVIYSIDTVVSSLATARTIDIRDEYSLEERCESTSDEMMHDSITKMWCKYLSLKRISHDECRTRSELITATTYLVPEIYTLSLIVEFKFQCTNSTPLVRPTIIVGSEDVGERKHDNPEKIRGSFAKIRKQR